MKPNKKLQLIIIGFVCLIYIALRFWHLTDSCLWFDEIFSVHAAEHDWRDLFWFVAQDLIHPQLFYILLKFWIQIGGESLFSLRLFPVVFSIIAVVPFLLLCRQLKLSFPINAVALTFFAVNGSLIKYAQEVRMYSLLMCLGLFSLWLFVRFVNMGKGFPTLLIINVLLVYTHYFGWLIIISELLAAAILARHRLKHIVLMCAVTFASFTPWIYAVWEASKLNSNVGQNIGWMTKPTFISIFQFVFDLFEPIYFEQSNTDAPAIILITLPILAIGIIAFGCYFAVWKDESELEKRNFQMLLIFFFTPITLAFVASWISPYSVWGTRHLSIVFAPFAVLMAIAFSKIEFPLLRSAALTIILLLFGAAFLFQATRAEPKYIWCAWENLAQSLDVNQPAKIYVFEDLVAYHFWFALRDSDKRIQVVKINNQEGLIEDKAYFLPRGFNEIQTANNFEGERFFVAFRDKSFNEFAPPLQNLKARDYRIGEPQVIEAQGLKAFLVEVWK